MRKLIPGIIPGIILIALLAAVVATYEPPAPPERYGDVARRECWKEASKNDRDQADCYDKKLTVKALQIQSTR